MDRGGFTLAMTQKTLRNLTACTLIAAFGFQQNLQAQAQLVSPAELQAAVLAASQTQQKNRDTIAAFLSTPQAQKALSAAKLDVRQVRAAVASLDEEELARLAARADKAQADFAAGRLTDRDLLIVLIGIAALILIIVAVR
jgi:hypothetical protein